MADTKLKTDYLIAGSGAVGMAFADVILSETDSDMIIVDRHHKPGGHWNVAYSFVTLHQPSAFYGVSSRDLGNGELDKTGYNRGLSSLASGAEISAYFDDLMQQDFLPSGRVRYFPMCEWDGENRFKSLLTGETYEVETAKKRVDATFLKTTVPSTHTPGFSVAEGMRFMPLNDLPKIDSQPEGFVVIGGGKTGIDACLWLLQNKVEPGSIRWIMPRDGWMIDRQNTQPREEFFSSTMGAQAAQFEAIAAAESVDDLFRRLEEAGILVRLDESVKPKMFHGATISRGELEALRSIRNVVRMGRVERIEKDRIVLNEGTISTNENIVHVDCSASAISNLTTKPIFEDDLITPQTVRSYQPVFSAAFIAHIEATRESTAEKNALCGVVPLPNHDTDWIRMMIPFMMNQYQWSRDPELRDWLEKNRLDGFSQLVRRIRDDETDKKAIMQRLRDSAVPAMAKLHQLMTEVEKAA